MNVLSSLFDTHSQQPPISSPPVSSHSPVVPPQAIIYRLVSIISSSISKASSTVAGINSDQKSASTISKITSKLLFWWTGSIYWIKRNPRIFSVYLITASTFLYIFAPTLFPSSFRFYITDSEEEEEDDDNGEYNGEKKSAKKLRKKSKKQRMQWLRRKKKEGKYTVGLINDANDCFANSNLQALSALRSLYGYICHLALLLPVEEADIAKYRQVLIDYERNKNESKKKPSSSSSSSFVSSSSNNLNGDNASTSATTTPTENNDDNDDDNDDYSVNRRGASITRAMPLEISMALGRMIVQLNEPILTPKALSPWSFLRVLENFYTSKISRSQHDAHELLHLILETLEIEYSRIKRYYIALQEEERGQSSASLNTSASQSNNNRIELPPFPFKGSTRDKITCSKCGYVSNTTPSSFIVLSLMVPQKHSVTLNELLLDFNSPEYIQDYGCTRCRLIALIGRLQTEYNKLSSIKKGSNNNNKSADNIKYTIKELSQYVDDPDKLPEKYSNSLPREINSPISKSTQFYKLPQILTIHLSRSIYEGYGASRNSCKVSVPEYLELIQDTSGQKQSESSEGRQSSSNSSSINSSSNGFAKAQSILGKKRRVQYTLVAMIRHKGTHYAGHYECFRRKNLTWWKTQLAAQNGINKKKQRKSTDTFSSVATDSNNNNNNHEVVDSASASSSSLSAAAAATTNNNNNNNTNTNGSSSNLESIQNMFSQFTSSSSSLSSSILGGQSEQQQLLNDVLPASINDDWWQISDDKVWEKSIKEVMKEESGAYLLFYERITK